MICNAIDSTSAPRNHELRNHRWNALRSSEQALGALKSWKRTSVVKALVRTARLSPNLWGLRRILPQTVQGGLQAGRTGVDRQQTPCVHDALHLSRSGARFSTKMPLVGHLALMISPTRFTRRRPRPADTLCP